MSGAVFAVSQILETLRALEVDMPTTGRGDGRQCRGQAWVGSGPRLVALESVEIATDQTTRSGAEQNSEAGDSRP